MYLECEWCGKTFYRKKQDRRNKHIYCSQDCITARDQSRYKTRFLSENKAYRLISYVDKKNVTIACKVCGNMVNTDSTEAMRRKTCMVCNNAKREIVKTYEDQAKKEAQINREITRQYNKLVIGLDKLIESIERAAELKEKAKEREKERTAAQRKVRELKRTGRLKNTSRIDKDITLSKVYKNDNGICYLCGGKCDYNDQIIDDNGYYITGKNYPTIDHVQPLRQGGTHTWDNVRLAHMRCNINRN